MLTYSPHLLHRGFESAQHPKGQPRWWPFLLPFDPTNWCACGIWSVHHALVALGQATTDRSLKSLHGNLVELTGKPFIDPSYGGLHLEPLCRVIKKSGCKAEAKVFRKRCPLKHFLRRHLDAGHPVILGSDPAQHWICVIGRQSQYAYVTADSADWPVVGWYDADSVLDWTGIQWGEKVDCVAVMPGAGMPKSRSLVPHADQLWQLLDLEPELAADWTNLLDDLLDVFWDTDFAPGGMPVNVFFRKHGDQMSDSLRDWSDFDASRIQFWIGRYQKVAEFHSLVVADGHLAESLSKLLLVLIARLSSESSYLPPKI